MLVFAITAGRGVWRTCRIPAGLLIVFVSAILGGVLSAVEAAAMLAIWHDPETLRAWQASGGLDEALWGVPLLLVPIGLVTGTAGAVLSKLFRAPFPPMTERR